MMHKILLLSLSLVLIVFPALATEKPADSMIRSVQGDLSRYEPMVDQMEPGSRSAARVLRFVPIMESRLGSSRNKDSVSWIETSTRLKTMKQSLLDIKAGKAATALAPKTPAKPITLAPPHHIAVASPQKNMSDPDRARKVDALVQAFYRDFNRTKPRALGDDQVVSGFAQKIEAMKASAIGFDDPSLGYVKQVKGSVIESEQYFHKRIDSIRAQINANKQVQAGVAAENKRGQMAAQAESARLSANNHALAQSEREIGALHRTFVRAYSSVRGSLVTLTADRLANPENAKDWKYRVNKLAGIVKQYQDKNNPKAKQDIAAYMAVKQQFDDSVKELAKNSKANKTALLELQASNADKQAAMQAQRHEEDLHRQFSNAYGTLGISLPYLNAETLADPAEARKWTAAVKGMGRVVSQYQGMDSAKVKKNIAIYEKVKGKVEAGLAENSAASGGLTVADLSRDYQKLNTYLVKNKEMFDKARYAPAHATSADLKKLETFQQSDEYKELKIALADFAKKYGDNRRAITKKFTVVNGGREWRAPDRGVPEHAFMLLSERINHWDSQQKGMRTNVVAEMEAFDGTKKYPSSAKAQSRLSPRLDVAEVNKGIEEIRKRLENFLKDYPEQEKVKQNLANLDDVKRKYIDGMNKRIDDNRWGDWDGKFQGPGDLGEIHDDIKRSFGLGDDTLAIQVDGQWQAFEKDRFGHLLNYRLPVKFAVKSKDRSDTAHVYSAYAVTETPSRALPFRGATQNFHSEDIRIKYLP